MLTHKERELFTLGEKIYDCWEAHKLEKFLEELEEREMSFAIAEGEDLSPKEYQLFSSAYTLCKRKLFNLNGFYFEQLGLLSQGAITELTKEESFTHFLKDFKQKLAPDVTNPQMVKNYQDTLTSLENHFNLRVKTK